MSINDLFIRIREREKISYQGLFCDVKTKVVVSKCDRHWLLEGEHLFRFSLIVSNLFCQTFVPWNKSATDKERKKR